MNKLLSIYIFFLLLTTSSAICSEYPDFKVNWQKLYITGDPRERSLAVEMLGSPNCRTSEGMAQLQFLSKEGLHDNSPLVRQTALSMLRHAFSPDYHSGCKADDELINTLVDALKDPSPLVREEIVRILGMTRTGKAILALEPILHDPEFTVRQQAAAAIGRIKDKQAIPLLLEMLNERKNWVDVFVQQEALYAIRKIVFAHHRTYIYRSNSGDRKEQEFQLDANLLEIIEKAMIHAADDPYLRREAFEFFSEYATPAALNIMQSATKDPDPEIRKMAYGGISLLGSQTTEKDSCGYKRISSALHDTSPSIRAAALYELSNCHGHMDESILVAHVVSGINDANQEVNAAAVAIAPVFGDSDIMNALVGRFGKEPYGNKGKAMEAFLKISYGITEGSGAILQMPSRKKHKISTGKHGYSQEPIIIIAPQAPPRKSIKTLAIGGKHIVESKQESTQNTGNDTIGTHSQKSAVEILLIRFPSLNVEGKVTALQTLDKLSDPRIRTFAISLVDDQNPRVRSNAITLATKFGTEDILPRLFISVQDKDPGVRYTTIQVLLAAKNLPEEYSLLRLSESTDPRVRDSLASAIGQNGFRQDLNELMLRMLDDNDPKVRLKVAQYFVNNHDKRSIDKLAKMLATDGMCSQAAYALAAQGDMRGNDALLEIGKGHCDTNNNMDNSSKRLYAVMALRKQKDPRVVQLICELLEEGKGDDYQLILNLGETRDKSAAPCLVSYGKKRKYGREVMLSLAKIASPEALDYLKESLDYTYQYDSDVVENAINAISATPGTRSVDILIEEFLKNKRYTNNILQGLGNRARWDISALSNIFKAAGNDQNNLGKIPFDIGLRAGDILMQRKIMGLTNDKDMDVRKGAIIALGALYDNSSLSLLEKLALENNVEIRVLANKALELRHNRSKK